MSESSKAAIEQRERASRGEPEPKKPKAKKDEIHIALTVEPDGTVSSVGESEEEPTA